MPFGERLHSAGTWAAKAILRGERIRYFVSAVVCAIANNLVLILLSRVGWSLLNLTLLSFATVGSLGYALHTRLTFGHRLGWYSYGRFMIGLSLGIPITYVALMFFCRILLLPMGFAAPATTILLFVYNYLSAKLTISGLGRRPDGPLDWKPACAVSEE